MAKNQPETIQSNSSSPSSIESKHQIEPQIVAYAWQGPLPSPGLLQDFDNVVPGLARRIVDQAEKEQSHRHEMQRRALDGELEDQRQNRGEIKRAQYLAFALVVFLATAGTVFTFSGHPKVGGTIFSVTIVSITGAYLAKRSGKQARSTADEDSHSP